MHKHRLKPLIDAAVKPAAYVASLASRPEMDRIFEENKEAALIFHDRIEGVQQAFDAMPESVRLHLAHYLEKAFHPQETRPFFARIEAASHYLRSNSHLDATVGYCRMRFDLLNEAVHALPVELYDLVERYGQLPTEKNEFKAWRESKLQQGPAQLVTRLEQV